MKYYLSSFKLGQKVDFLKKLIPACKKTAYITNALDLVRDRVWRAGFIGQDRTELAGLGLEVNDFDLRRYFDRQDRLMQDLSGYGVIWVSGGNVFVLRQAMFLSGFDRVIRKLARKKDLLYGGYSAGVCVLAPSLKGLELVDSTAGKPYGGRAGLIWEGLGLIPYVIVPHFKSDHPESARIDQVVARYEKDGTSYKALRDGEVIVID